MRLHLPILKTATAAVGSFLIVLLLEASSPSGLEPVHLVFFAAGLLYTQFFEHFSHRVAMHRRLPLLESVRFRHLVHHRVFHDENFKTARASDLQHIAGHPWMFPVLISIHYMILIPVLSSQELIAFLFGALLHYLSFETTHWFTHIEDNGFDRVVSRIPLLRDLRAHQIEHHRAHHQVPEVAFNFNPPYLGDILVARMPRHADALGFSFPRVIEPAETRQPIAPAPASPDPTRAAWNYPLLRFGSAVVAGLAIVGLVIVTHGRWSQSKPPAPNPEAFV